MTPPARARGLLSQHERERIDELAGKGLSAGRIAQILNRIHSTVAWYMYTHGLKSPAQTDTPRTCVRNGRTVRHFSRAEDAFITAIRIEGHSAREIARLTNERFGTERSAPTIRNRLKMLGSIEDELAADTTRGEA